MSNIFKRISTFCDIIVSRLAIFAIAAYTILIFVGVLSRFVLKLPIVSAIELSRVGFVWSSLLGAAVAYKRGLHISFTVVLSALSKKAGFYLTILIDIITLIFFILVLYKSIFFTIRVSPSVLSSTQMSAAVMYFPLPFSITAMIFHCINFITQDLNEVFHKGTLENGASL